MNSTLPDYRFGRCDGRHEMVDLGISGFGAGPRVLVQQAGSQQ